MADNHKFVRYGDKTMPLGELTLEQAKEALARHFPELANPKVETKTEGEKTIYVFSKQAGHKGSGANLARIIARRLDRLTPVQVVPYAIVRTVARENRGVSIADLEIGAEENLNFASDIEPLNSARAALLALVPSLHARERAEVALL